MPEGSIYQIRGSNLGFEGIDQFYPSSVCCLRQQTSDVLAHIFALIHSRTIYGIHANRVRLAELDENTVEAPPLLIDIFFNSFSDAERDVD